MKKEEIIEILKNKGNKTYLELAKLTGYHEKSLIRINREIKRGTYTPSHGNSFREPYNKINDKLKEELISEFQKRAFKTKKAYYNYLKAKNINYSYAFLCSIIPKKEKKEPLKIIKPSLNIIKRKMIKYNLMQYDNKRYEVITSKVIKHHEVVDLVIDKNKKPLYIKYRNKRYNLLFLKKVYSRKGNSKYF